MPFARFGEAVTVRPSSLPVELGPGPFSTSRALGLGVPPQRLGRTDLTLVTRGVRAPAAPATLVERAAAFTLGMPGDRAFSHLTAALFWGLPLPLAVEQAAAVDGAPLHVIAPTGAGMAKRFGVVGHRGLEVRAVASPPGTGLRVVDAADTWCDLGELPRGTLSITDLVVVGDALRENPTEGRGRAAAGPDPGAARGAIAHGDQGPPDVRRRRLPGTRGERTADRRGGGVAGRGRSRLAPTASGRGVPGRVPRRSPAAQPGRLPSRPRRGSRVAGQGAVGRGPAPRPAATVGPDALRAGPRPRHLDPPDCLTRRPDRTRVENTPQGRHPSRRVLYSRPGGGGGCGGRGGAPVGFCAWVCSTVIAVR